MVARPKPTRPSARDARETTGRSGFAEAVSQGLGWLVVLGVLTVGLIVLPDMQDRFRLIKESAVRVEALLGVVMVTIAVAFGGTQRLREMAADRPALFVAALAVLWTAITMVPSSNRAISAGALVSVFCATLLFLVVWYAAPRVPMAVFDVLVITVCVNSVLAALQETQTWQPFESPLAERGHTETTGLIDNPNILGSYLAVAAIALAVAAWKARGTRQIYYGSGAVIAVAGVLISQTRTAIIAIVAVAVIAAAVRSLRWAAIAAATAAGALLLGWFLGIDGARRVVNLPLRALQDVHSASSGRVIPFIIATRMFRDAPLTGLGPGTYGYNYMAYQSEFAGELPPGRRRFLGTNFGETHNDHLQVLAETGLPGYAILLAGILVLVRAPRGTPGTDLRFVIGRELGFPLATAFVVIALAQFPLQIAVMRHLLLTLAALVVAWRDR